MTLAAKLNPARFPNMSGKMAAIVGCIIGETFTNPALAELYVTSDGCVLARAEDDIGANEFIGRVDQLRSNWDNLISCAGLTDEERAEAAKLYDSAIGRN